MADIKLDGLTVASSSGSPTVVNLDSDVASRITAKGIAKAWVCFNGGSVAGSGTTMTGVVSSYNVTSVHDNGGTTGNYTVVFAANTFSDENYTCVRNGVNTGAGHAQYYCGFVSQTSSQTRFLTGYPTNFSATTTNSDTTRIELVAFGS